MSQCEQNSGDCELSVEGIYAQHDDFIRSVIQYAAKGHDEQDDIYQEVFVTLSQKEDFDGINNIKGYLYRLIVNKVNELARKNVTANLRLKKYVQWKTSKDDMFVQPEVIVDDEVAKTVELLKDYLSEKESQAILIRFQHECDNEQGAQKMNVQKETFIRYISVGLKKIRDIMKSQKGPE